MACARFVGAMYRCSVAPAEAFTTAGVTSTVRASGMRTPWTPAISAVRSRAPKFCTSCKASRISTNGQLAGLLRAVQDVREVDIWVGAGFEGDPLVIDILRIKLQARHAGDWQPLGGGKLKDVVDASRRSGRFRDLKGEELAAFAAQRLIDRVAAVNDIPHGVIVHSCARKRAPLSTRPRRASLAAGVLGADCQMVVRLRVATARHRPVVD